MNNENWKGHTKHQLWSERHDPYPQVWFEEQKQSVAFISKVETIAWVLLGIGYAIMLAFYEGSW